jgi:hypothetical protein
MGTRDKVANVGKRGTYVLRGDGGMAIDVEIVDYKSSYGRDRWLIKPIAGAGEVWTEQNPLA